MKRYSEATDAAGITHYVNGELRYVKRAGRRRRRGKDGHYETRAGCQWWCTNTKIPKGFKAHPGKSVDCMTCIADPPQPQALNYVGTMTGRMSSATPNRTVMMSTPGGPQTVNIFEAGVRRMSTRRR